MLTTYPGGNQTSHAPREAAAKASDSKHGVGKQKTWLAAKNIAKLAIERLGSGHGEEIGRSDP